MHVGFVGETIKFAESFSDNSIRSTLSSAKNRFEGFECDLHRYRRRSRIRVDSAISLSQQEFYGRLNEIVFGTSPSGRRHLRRSSNRPRSYVTLLRQLLAQHRVCDVGNQMFNEATK